MSNLSTEELQERRIGYIRDNRHFLNVPLTSINCKQFVPSKEKREIQLIQMELISSLSNPDYFQVVGIKEVKRKYKNYYIYILRDTRNSNGCGVFIADNKVICIKLKGYSFTDPCAIGTDWICENVTIAMKKTGKIKEAAYK